MEKESTKLRILPINSSIVTLEQARQCIVGVNCDLHSVYYTLVH